MNKTLGQIAHDAGGFTRQWQHMGAAQREDWERIAQAVIEAQQVAVPAGWVLVPIEPTDAMCEAAWEGEGVDYVGEHKRIHRADLAYIRMLAAAQGEKQ